MNVVSCLLVILGLCFIILFVFCIIAWVISMKHTSRAEKIVFSIVFLLNAANVIFQGWALLK
jgi:hypothetical protein